MKRKKSHQRTMAVFTLIAAIVKRERSREINVASSNTCTLLIYPHLFTYIHIVYEYDNNTIIQLVRMVYAITDFHFSLQLYPAKKHTHTHADTHFVRACCAPRRYFVFIV